MSRAVDECTWPSAPHLACLPRWHCCCHFFVSQSTTAGNSRALGRALQWTLDSQREGRMMNRTRRTIGFSAFAVLVVLGGGWALEKAHSNSQRQGGAAVVEPASDAE